MAFFGVDHSDDAALTASPLSGLNPSDAAMDDNTMLQLLMEPFVPSLYSSAGASQIDMASMYSQASSASDLDLSFLLGTVPVAPVTPPTLQSPGLNYVWPPLDNFNMQPYPSPTPAFIPSPVSSLLSSSPQVSPKPSPDNVNNHPLLQPLSTTTEPGLDDILEAMKTPTPLNLLFKRSQAKNEHTTKPMRFRPTDGEYALLTGIFNKNQFPSRALREKLAAHLGLNMRQVQLWFQNRRASLKSAGMTFERPKKASAVFELR